MRYLVSNKKKSNRVRRNAKKNRPELIGGGYKLLPARLPYAKRNGSQVYTAGEATIYVWGYRLVRAPHGRRIHYRIPLRHPVINDSTPCVLEDLNSTPDDTSHFAKVDSPLSYSSTGPQSMLASLTHGESKSTEVPNATRAQQDILPVSPGPVGEVPQGLTEIGKQQLVDRLMQEFWNIFNGKSTTHGYHTSDHSSGVSPQGLDTFSQSSTSMPSTTSQICGQKRVFMKTLSACVRARRNATIDFRVAGSASFSSVLWRLNISR
ncbi:hypothetical protein BDZ45DRAFT_188482 [Acephala macrosclerotiorum]|nr:hypothetical protein BDZ45DRAFT_188482 [Acephala macrosclerotiorum]